LSPSRDLEKACGLDEALFADAVDLQSAARGCGTDRANLRNSTRSRRDQLIEAGHMAQQRHTGRVEIDATVLTSTR